MIPRWIPLVKFITNAPIIISSIHQCYRSSKPQTGLSEQEYLTQLAREGWVRLLQDKVTDDDSKKIYGDRVKKEMKVIEDANLSGYFLIVWDIIKWCVDQGWMVGAGRGSAAGCLISYLVGITQVDPIEFDLLFETILQSGSQHSRSCILTRY